MDDTRSFVTSLLVLVLVTALVDPAHGQVSGAATCDSAAPGDSCKLSWNLSQTPRAFYWAQQLDPDSGAWRNLEERPTDTASRSARSEPVEGGYLYRVLACNDSARTTDCVGSTLIWAPVIPRGEKAAESIPERVEFSRPDGTLMRFRVDKNQSLLHQVVQFNVYQLARTLSRARIDELPEMTAPPAMSPNSGEYTDIDVVHANVYAAYTAERGSPITPPPSSEPPKLYESHKPEPHP